jgi:hypothetical protein
MDEELTPQPEPVAEEAQPDPEQQHRALLAEALLEHAEEVQDDAEQLWPGQVPRAEAARQAAASIARGDPLPYRVGRWGGLPNYECLWCVDAHLSERAAAIHGTECRYRPGKSVARPSTRGGIT